MDVNGDCSQLLEAEGGMFITSALFHSHECCCLVWTNHHPICSYEVVLVRMTMVAGSLLKLLVFNDPHILADYR